MHESPVIGPVGAMTPVVIRLLIGRDRNEAAFEARMRDGTGEVWSFGCSHLHRTADAARKCFSRLRRSWAEWDGAERVEVGPSGYSVIELRRGLPLMILRRMTRLSDFPGDGTLLADQG